MCFILPVWIGLWAIDVFEIFFHIRFYPPYVYFVATHFMLAAVIVFIS